MYSAQMNALYPMQSDQHGVQQSNPQGIVPGGIGGMNRLPTHIPPPGQVYGGPPPAVAGTNSQPLYPTNQPPPQTQLPPPASMLNQTQQNQASLQIARLQSILNSIQHVQQQSQQVAAAGSPFQGPLPTPQGPPSTFPPQIASQIPLQQQPPPLQQPIGSVAAGGMYRQPVPQQYTQPPPQTQQPPGYMRPAASQYPISAPTSTSLYASTSTGSQFQGSSQYNPPMTGPYSTPSSVYGSSVGITSYGSSNTVPSYVSTSSTRTGDSYSGRIQGGNQRYDTSRQDEEEEVAGVFKRKPVSIIKKEEPSYVKINLKYQDKPTNGRGYNEDWKYCELCNIRFAEKKHYQVHCDGMLHLSKMRQQQPRGSLHLPDQEKLVTPSSVIYRRTEDRPSDRDKVFENVGKIESSNSQYLLPGSQLPQTNRASGFPVQSSSTQKSILKKNTNETIYSHDNTAESFPERNKNLSSQYSFPEQRDVSQTAVISTKSTEGYLSVNDSCQPPNNSSRQRNPNRCAAQRSEGLTATVSGSAKQQDSQGYLERYQGFSTTVTGSVTTAKQQDTQGYLVQYPVVHGSSSMQPNNSSKRPSNTKLESKSNVKKCKQDLPSDFYMGYNLEQDKKLSLGLPALSKGLIRESETSRSRDQSGTSKRLSQSSVSDRNREKRQRLSSALRRSGERDLERSQKTRRRSVQGERRRRSREREQYRKGQSKSGVPSSTSSRRSSSASRDRRRSRGRSPVKGYNKTRQSREKDNEKKSPEGGNPSKTKIKTEKSTRKGERKNETSLKAKRSTLTKEEKKTEQAKNTSSSPATTKGSPSTKIERKETVVLIGRMPQLLSKAKKEQQLAENKQERQKEGIEETIQIGTTPEEDEQVIVLLEPLFNYYKCDVIRACVLNPKNRQGNFDKALLVQRCIDDLRKFPSSFSKVPSTADNTKPVETLQRVDETSAKTLMLSTTQKPFDQTPKASNTVPRTANTSKAASFTTPSGKVYQLCPVKSCTAVSEDLKRHVRSTHLPWYVYSGGQKRMPHLDDLLTKISSFLGAYNSDHLLELCLKNKWYPDISPIAQTSYKIDNDDEKCVSNFYEWKTGTPVPEAIQIMPPNSVAALTHWKVLCCLLSQLTVDQQCDMLNCNQQLNLKASAKVLAKSTAKTPDLDVSDSSDAVLSQHDESGLGGASALSPSENDFVTSDDELDYNGEMDEETPDPKFYKEAKIERPGKNSSKSKYCMVKSCSAFTEHLKRHIKKVHLPPYICSGGTERLPKVENLLGVLAGWLDAKDEEELLEMCILNEWYPEMKNCEDYTVAQDDDRLVSEIYEYLNGEPMIEDTEIMPPNSVAALTHWRVMCCLINQLTLEQQHELLNPRLPQKFKPSDKSQVTGPSQQNFEEKAESKEPAESKVEPKTEASDTAKVESLIAYLANKDKHQMKTSTEQLSSKIILETNSLVSKEQPNKDEINKVSVSTIVPSKEKDTEKSVTRKAKFSRPDLPWYLFKGGQTRSFLLHELLLKICLWLDAKDLKNLVEICSTKSWFHKMKESYHMKALKSHETKLLAEFHFDITGGPIKKFITLFPPNCVGALSHQKVILILLNQVPNKYKEAAWKILEKDHITEDEKMSVSTVNTEKNHSSSEPPEEKVKTDQKKFSEEKDDLQSLQIKAKKNVKKENVHKPQKTDLSIGESNNKHVEASTKFDRKDELQKEDLETQPETQPEGKVDLKTATSNEQNKDDKIVSIQMGQKEEGKPTEVLGDVEGIDTFFNVELLMEKSGSSNLDDILSQVPKPAVSFNLIKAITSFCSPKKFPDDNKREFLLSQNPNLYFAYGLHPRYAHKTNTAEVEMVNEHLETEHCVALGLVGCDYRERGSAYSEDQLTVLQFFFTKQSDSKLPIIFTCQANNNRSHASEDCLKLAKKYLRSDHPVVRQSFNGSLKEMRNWRKVFPETYFGVSTILLDDQRHPDLQSVVKMLPLRYMMLESGAPLLQKWQKDAKFSTPYAIADIAKRIASLKNVSVNEVFAATTEAAKRVYKLE